MKFWIAWAIDAVVAAIAVCFFLVGLADGSVSSFNIALWACILLVLAVFALLIVILLISPPRWN